MPPCTHSSAPDAEGQSEIENDLKYTPEPQPDKDSIPNLAEAITLMTKELKHCDSTPNASGANAKKPDTSNGTDPKKLNNFILLCNLFFQNNSTYSNDEAKVTFALSYPHGIALEYFEPTLMDSDKDPEWLTDWSAFVQVPYTQFGPIDPTANAEDNLKNLRMHDNHHIVKYNVDFNCLAIQTSWDDSILQYCYYSSLVECIKDIIGQVDKPSTLTELKNLTHSIDACHWEWLCEKSHSDKSNQSNNNRSDKKPQNFNSQLQSTASKPQQQQNSNDKSNKSSSTSTPAKSAISDALTKDGKLTQQEWQHCLTNNLCMYCGGVGHKASDCNKASSSAAKATLWDPWGLFFIHLTHESEISNYEGMNSEGMNLRWISRVWISDEGWMNFEVFFWPVYRVWISNK